ncbi:MAG: glycosyltransferase family 9 protein [Sneathiella sp.]|nr:glycosyltransferase family 9 protein [Sneathiella sp.]
MGSAENILVIKHGALGDVVLAQGPFQAIRAHHPNAHITLLTTKLFKPFLEKSGLFNDIWVDERAKIWNILKIAALRKRLREGDFDRVYDLQTSSRSSSYLKLFAATNLPEWSGTAPGCSHPHMNKNRGALHTIERQAEQLRQAGIESIPDVDFSWAAGDLAKFVGLSQFAVLVPGGSAHRPEKRWPAARYAELAVRLQITGVSPVLIGGAAEAEAIEIILKACPKAIDLSGKTSLEDLVTLGMAAQFAIGNDTGPLHLVAAVGCPVTVLFSKASDPARARPRGRDVTVLRSEILAELSLDAVIETLKMPSEC